MNQRIQALIDQVGTDISGKWISVDDAETLAEAIIRECCTALQPALRDMISRGQGRDMILEHFGIDPKAITTFMLDRKIAWCKKQLAEQKPGWVCSKCGVDRIRDVCPKGHTAALSGECPMTGVASLRVKV